MSEPKIVEVKVRFIEKTNIELLEYCKKQNITRAEAVRRAVNLLLAKEK